MNQPTQRRGLGRGLGSLIPTSPPEQPAPRAEEMGPAGDSTPGRHSAKAPQNGAQNGGLNGGGVATLVAERPSDERPAEPAPLEVAGAYFAELPVGSITPNPRQPRQVFEEEAMAELVHSVKEIGLLQPIVVRRTGDSSYELIMGERRWRATQQAGMDTIPAIVRQTDDDAMLRDALLENLHRSNLNPLEEAAAYRQLLDDFGCTHDELAGRIGRSRPQISNTLRLLNLSPAVQRRVAAGVISAGHARALLGVADSGAQDRLAGRVVSEGISVRGLEELVSVGEHGEEDDATTPVRHPRPTAPGLAELGDRLSDRLDTRVRVTLGRNKGKVAIEFASLTDLERIVSVIDPRNRDDRPI
jgi:ParB family chromosome partitioning protein